MFFPAGIGELKSAAPKPDMLSIKPESAAPKPDLPAVKPGTEATRPEPLPAIKPVPPGIEAKRQSAASPGTEKTKAEAWKKAERDGQDQRTINYRYVKLNSTVLVREEKKKKKKARNKLDKAEPSELEQKRARASTKFRNETDYIKEVADRARAQAEEAKK